MSVTPTAARPRLHQRRWLLPLVAVVLTGLAGGVMVWTLQGRQNSGPAVPVAIVNSDKPVTTGSGKDQKTVAAGRQLAAGLTQPATSDQTPLSWVLVDSDDAQAGLKNGGYYAVLTIPENFSAAVTSTSGDHPTAAELQLVSNDAASAAVAAMARLAVGQAAATLGDQVTSGFVDNLLQSMTSIHSSLTSSAKSAKQLADSSHDLADSSRSLYDGSRSLASGAEALASGAEQAAAGSAQVSSGADNLAAATGNLEDGAKQTARGASRLATSATRVARGNAAVADQTSTQSGRLDRLKTASGRVADGSSRVAADARRLAESCPDTVDRRYCAEVRRLAAASRVEAVAVRGVHAGVRVAARRADRVADASKTLARASNSLAGGVSEVADGADEVSDGAASLDNAADSLSSGASAAAVGTATVATGAQQNSTGADQLSSGAKQLASGSDQLADGADSLAKGLDNGAESVPSYSDDQRKQLDDVVTTPVNVTATAGHTSTVAAGITPAVLGLALWLGTLMMFLTRGAVPVGDIWAQATPGRRVLIGWLPAVLVGAVQAVVLLGIVAVAGVNVASPLGLALFCGLGVLAFAATNQALVSVFGGVGRLGSLAFFVIEAAALGGLVPIQTAPAFIQLLNGVLPVPRFVDGAGQLLLGGGVGSLTEGCVVLGLWTAVALVAATLATARSRPRLAASPTVPPLTAVRYPTVNGVGDLSKVS